LQRRRNAEKEGTAQEAQRHREGWEREGLGWSSLRRRIVAPGGALLPFRGSGCPAGYLRPTVLPIFAAASLCWCRRHPARRSGGTRLAASLPRWERALLHGRALGWTLPPGLVRADPPSLTERRCVCSISALHHRSFPTSFSVSLRLLCRPLLSSFPRYIDTPSRPRVNWKSVLPRALRRGLYSRLATLSSTPRIAVAQSWPGVSARSRSSA
jgi:hypothetical protein